VALVDTDYGRLVALKVALFVVIVATAAVNRLKLRPRLSAADARSTLVALRRNALAELCLHRLTITNTWRITCITTPRIDSAISSCAPAG